MREPTLEEKKRWVRQWAFAARMLPRIKLQELRAMSEQQRLQRVEAALSLAALARSNPRRWKTSGLVEQQAHFQKLHRKRK